MMKKEKEKEKMKEEAEAERGKMNKGGCWVDGMREEGQSRAMPLIGCIGDDSKAGLTSIRGSRSSPD